MRNLTDNLIEFTSILDSEKIDEKSVDAILEKINAKKLVAVLASHKFFRKIFIKKWIKEVEKALGISISLQIVKDEITPFMQESGALVFSRKDIARRERIFMLLAHEVAHFILAEDERYETLKILDKQYRIDEKERAKMLSPIEYCANLITLKLFFRCKMATKRAKLHTIIQQLALSLKKQLT